MQTFFVLLIALGLSVVCEALPLLTSHKDTTSDTITLNVTVSTAPSTPSSSAAPSAKQTAETRCFGARDAQNITLLVNPSNQASRDTSGAATGYSSYKDVKSQASKIVPLTQMLLRKYVMEAIREPDFLKVYVGVHFSTFPLVGEQENLVNKQINTLLSQTYREMANITVYLNKVRLENLEFDQGGRSIFYENINELSILHCNLMYSFRNLTETTTGLEVPDATEDVLDAMYDVMGRMREMEKYMRDYVIIRDYHHYLEYLVEVMHTLETKQ